MEKEQNGYIPKLMTLKAVCRELNLPSTPDYVAKIRRLIHKHDVRHYKIGNEIALSMGQLIYLLRQMQCSSSPRGQGRHSTNSQGRYGSGQDERSEFVSLQDILTEKEQKHMRNVGNRK